MLLTLQVVEGPNVGRKASLRSGQVARVGRTEWSDFSFPGDPELAEVHFSVRCNLAGARVQRLAADKPLKVNAKDVQEEDVQHGDKLTAGKTTFVILFDDRPLNPPAAQTVATADLAAASAAPVIFAGMSAAAIGDHLDLSDDAKQTTAAATTGSQMVQSLAAKKLFAPAVRVQAHLLPKREAVWWGWLCVSEVCGEKLSPAEAKASAAAHAWVVDPKEGNRRAAETAAAATQYDGPGSWLAMAAFWSEGSIGPVEVDPIAGDERLTGQAITSALMIAAVHDQPKLAPERYAKFLSLADEVSSGAKPAPEKAS